MNQETTPPYSNYWGFWGTLLWGIVIAAAFVLIQTVTILLYVKFGMPELPWEEMQPLLEGANENGTLIALATLATTLIGSTLIAGIIKLKKGSTISGYLALNLPPLKTTLRWFGFLALIIIAADLFIIGSGKPIVPKFMTKTYASAEPVWLFWIALIICAPLFEELFFRGFLLGGFQHTFLKPTGAVLVTTLSWAVIHHQYDRYGIKKRTVGLLPGIVEAVCPQEADRGPYHL